MCHTCKHYRTTMVMPLCHIPSQITKEGTPRPKPQNLLMCHWQTIEQTATNVYIHVEKLKSCLIMFQWVASNVDKTWTLAKIMLYDYTSMIQETEWTIVHVNAEHGGSKQGLATMRTKAICITSCKPTLHRESMLRNFWQQNQDIGWGLDIWCTWCTQRVPKFGNEKDLLQDAASK